MNDSEIRISVRTFYDMQKLRIQNGNRIVAAFRHKLGLDSSDCEENNPKAKKALDEIRQEYKRITDGVKRITKNFKSDSELITSYGEINLIQAYEKQLEAEALHEKIILLELEKYPIWTNFLKDLRGTGPLMSGVIVSEIDITKANTPSALHAYAGLDVLTWFECKKKFQPNAPEKLRKRHPDGYKTNGPAVTGWDKDWFMLSDLEGNQLGLYGLPAPNTKGLGEGRCKKPHHLVPKTYVSRKTGEIVETTGITFNPFLKTKMVGVLGDVLIKLNPDYKGIYDRYKEYIKNRDDNITRYYIRASKTSDNLAGPYYDKARAEEILAEMNGKKSGKETVTDIKGYKIFEEKGRSPGHIHKMANRYMIKCFLTDLWVEWRTLEGLPVCAPYADEKLRA